MVERKSPHVVFTLKNSDLLFAYMLSREMDSYPKAHEKAKALLANLKPGDHVEVYCDYYRSEIDSIYNLPDLEYFYQVYNDHSLITEEPSIHQLNKVDFSYVDGEVRMEENKDMSLWYKNYIFIIGCIILGIAFIGTFSNYLTAKNRVGKGKIKMLVEEE